MERLEDVLDSMVTYCMIQLAREEIRYQLSGLLAYGQFSQISLLGGWKQIKTIIPNDGKK